LGPQHGATKENFKKRKEEKKILFPPLHPAPGKAHYRYIVFITFQREQHHQKNPAFRKSKSKQ
jgi:hypothetical protein